MAQEFQWLISVALIGALGTILGSTALASGLPASVRVATGAKTPVVLLLMTVFSVGKPVLQATVTSQCAQIAAPPFCLGRRWRDLSDASGGTLAIGWRLAHEERRLLVMPADIKPSTFFGDLCSNQQQPPPTAQLLLLHCT
jgi:hypothetical protein